MAAIVGFNSQWSDHSVVLPGCPSDLALQVKYGHLAFEDNAGRIYGFLPDPVPLVVEPLGVYPGRYFDQTNLFAMLKGRVRVDRFNFSLNYYDEFFVYQRYKDRENVSYCMHAPLLGPPYNCISYIREVLELGDLPRTNFINDVFEDLKMRKGFVKGGGLR